MKGWFVSRCRFPAAWRFEAGTLLVIVAVAAGALVVAELTEESLAEGNRAVDIAILLALRVPGDASDPIGPKWLESIVRDITALGGTAVLTLISAAVIGFLLLASKRGAALLTLFSVSGGALLGPLLKVGFDRPRPDLVAHLVEVHSASFPSGHALFSAVTYLTLGALVARVVKERRLKIYVMGAALIFTLLVGVSRVYLGVHWPTDVVAGWLIGASWAAICWRIALALQRRGEVEAADR